MERTRKLCPICNKLILVSCLFGHVGSVRCRAALPSERSLTVKGQLVWELAFKLKKLLEEDDESKV